MPDTRVRDAFSACLIDAHLLRVRMGLTRDEFGRRWRGERAWGEEHIDLLLEIRDEALACLRAIRRDTLVGPGTVLRQRGRTQVAHTRQRRTPRAD